MSSRSSPSNKSELDELLEEADDFDDNDDITPSSMYDDFSSNLNTKFTNSKESRTESLNVFGNSDKKFYSGSSKKYEYNSNRKSKENSYENPSIVAEVTEQSNNNNIKQNNELLNLQQMLQEANTKISLLSGELSNLKVNYENVCNSLNVMNKSLEPMKKQFAKMQEDNKKLIEENQRLERTSASLTRKIDYYESELNKKDDEINKYKNIIESLNSRNNSVNRQSNTESDQPSNNQNLRNEQVQEDKQTLEDNQTQDTTQSNANQNQSSQVNNESQVKEDKNNSNDSNVNVKNNKENNNHKGDLDYQTKLDKPVKDFSALYTQVRFDFDDRVFDLIKKGEYYLSREKSLTSIKNTKGIGKIKNLGSSIAKMGAGFAKGHYKNNIKTVAKTGIITCLASAFLGPLGVLGGATLCTASEVIKLNKKTKNINQLLIKQCRQALRFFKELNERGYHLDTNFKTAESLEKYIKLIVKDYSDRFFPDEVEDMKTFLRFVNVCLNVDMERLCS